MSILDMKMNKIITNIQLHNEEVTAVAMNELENTFIAGFRDGMVKIYNYDKECEMREQFLAFSSMGNKKGSVSGLKVHPSNGALFASSLTGNFKVLRTKV